MNLHIVKYRKIWYVISTLMIGLSLVSFLGWGLKLSIEFTGGSLLEIRTSSPVETVVATQSLLDAGYQEAVVQSSSNNGMVIRLRELNPQDHTKVIETLQTAVGEFTELRFDSIGPVIGGELKQTATYGVLATLVLIGLYITIAYRKVSEPIAGWKYGLLTVVTAFHDVIVPLGVFAALGHYLHWEVGSAFIAAILTILGYSISDTVVVFDRTRENLLKHVGGSFEEVVDLSINQTFVRSISTSMTTLVALLAVYLFGGDSTKPFALALIIGIATGTYSSICIASPLLVTWEKWRK